ncbi:MAG: hypothetical protein P4M11_14770 [Candidatus Pacebacteria bacterium]|nr:hypothetical protein [Candidatus Paceibacterota bacterium]
MDKGSIALILLLCLSLLGFFVRYKNICWRRSYLSYLLSMYRDVTFFGLSLMVLLHYFLDISAYTPYMIPAVSILCVYALESILIYRAFLLNPVASPQELNSVTDGMVYIETILRNSALVGSGSETGTFRGDEAKEAERLLYSMLAAHHRTCEEVNCVCRDIDAVQVNVSNVDAEHRPRVVAKLVDEQGWKRFGKRQLNDLINKYPRNAALHIFLACVEHYDLKNKYKTLYNLRKAEEMRPSPSEHLDIMYIQTQVEGDMALKKNDLTFAGNRQQNWGSSGVQLSASRLYKFMQLYNSFMEEIEICTSSSVNFWTILLQETPDAEHLGVIGNSISTSLKRIHNIYMKPVRKNTASTNFLFKYCVFLRHIVYDDITADMVSSK